MYTSLHVSRVTCHGSHACVTCHLSPVTFNTSLFSSSFLDQVVKLVGGGSVIIKAYPVLLSYLHTFFAWLTCIELNIFRLLYCHICLPQCYPVCTVRSGNCKNCLVNLLNNFYLPKVILRYFWTGCSGSVVELICMSHAN